MINYVKGNLLSPAGNGERFLCHCVNNEGRMGAGVALALMTKWPQVRSDYIGWYNLDVDFYLGNIQIIRVEPEISVVNIIGQDGCGFKNGIAPIRYDALRFGFEKLSDFIIGSLPLNVNPSVHCPRIGCGLAGGTWEEVEKIIEETVCKAGIPVTVYDI